MAEAIGLVKKFVGLDLRMVGVGAGLSARIAMPKCQDKLLDLYIAEDKRLEGRTPYYGVLWPSAIGLAHEASAHIHDGDAVLELGCGLGLGGIAAALTANPSRVLVTDHDPASVYLAKLSAKLSGVSRRVLRGAPVDWNRREQWQRHGLEPGAFDVAIAADIIYEAEACTPVATILAHALRPGGRFLLADSEARVHRRALRDAMTSSGKFVPLDELTSVVELDMDDWQAPPRRIPGDGPEGALPSAETSPGSQKRVVLQVYERNEQP